MKKSIIFVLAVVMVAVFASAAYASTNSTYAAWVSAAPNDNPATPHKGYAVNTNKCAVCHAVHKAEESGQVLLRSTVADACTFCHISTDLGVTRIYGGDPAIYAADTPKAQSFGGGFAHNIACVDCHAVHGAQTLDGANPSKILKDWDYTAYQDGGWHAYETYALDVWPTPDTEADDNGQISAFCSGCHKYVVYDYEQQTQYIATDAAPYSWDVAKSHVMTDLVDGYQNTNATVATGTAVAYAPSSYCRSCHDAGLIDLGYVVTSNSFPHYTQNNYRFMTVGESLAASGSVNTTGTVDGLCLKCHRDGAGNGVGLNF